MNIIIIFICVMFTATKSTFNESNPYEEALKKRPWESVQAYVEVRPGAFIFYWLYYADGTRIGAVKKPLIIWIQGGPGLAATGIANFMEIGPLNMEMQPRNHTWVNGRNLLLIDHPAGAGFSYVTDDSLLVNSDQMIVDDLLKTIQAFFETHKEYNKTPTFLFSQSYGGKNCPRLAYYLHKEIERKNLNMNLQGLGIGSALVNPRESVLMVPVFSYSMGVIDRPTYLKSVAIAKKMIKHITDKKYADAAELYSFLSVFFWFEAGFDFNINNINQRYQDMYFTELGEKIDKYLKPTLKMVNQSISYTVGNLNIYNNMNQDYFAPSTKFLEMLLNETQLKIAVYNGNLDHVTPIAGASNWVHKLKWPGADEFRAAKSTPINGERNGMYKEARQLSFWSVFGSGHWVPEDNPTAMEHILQYVTSLYQANDVSIFNV